jgi:hypothetical protein
MRNARTMATVVAVLCTAAAACQDDNHRLDTLEQRDTQQEQAVIASTATSASTLAASKAYADGLHTAAMDAVQAEATRAQASEAAEAKARMDGEAATAAAAKTYTDQAVGAVKVPTVTHLKNLTTGQVLGERRGIYATAELVGGEEVDLDWVTVLVRAWDAPNCTQGGGKVYVNFVDVIAPLPAPPPSVLDSARYISREGAVMKFDSEPSMFIMKSFEDANGQCQASGNFSRNGFAAVESKLPVGGATDDGRPVKLHKARELKTVRIPPA